MTKEEREAFERMANNADDTIADDVGGAVGATIGGAVGGPLGAAVGGVIGDTIGGAIGGGATDKAGEAVAANSIMTTGSAAEFYQNQMYQLSVPAAAGWLSINQSVVAKVTESILAMDLTSEGGIEQANALLELVKKAQNNSKPEL